MQEVQKAALDRAIKFLNSVGAQYAIVIEDQKFGDLEVVTKSKTKRPKKRSFAQFNIRGKMSGMNVGDVVTFKAGHGFKAEEIRGNASAYGIQKFGKGSCITAIKDDEVQIMRVA